LQPCPIVESGEVVSLNLTRGCVHRCGFCSARGYPTYPGGEVIYAFMNTPELLDAELSGRSRRPRAVFLSPATDPFPPLAEIQAETARVVEVLAKHDVEAWLMTRGYIRPSALDVLAAHHEHVRVTIALTTLDRNLQRILEPLTAPPQLRLRQIGDLHRLGVPVQVALDPLVPGLTDTRENLASALEALAGAGIRHVTAGYMFLRPGIRANLIRALEPHGWEQMVLHAYTGGPFLTGDGVAAAQYLPKARRQRGYAAMMALAAGLGISVSVSGTSNPDFTTPRRPTPVENPPRRLLPQFIAAGRQLRFA